MMDNSFFQQLNAECPSKCVAYSKNQTFVTEFVLLGLTDLVELRLPVFAVILVFFLVNITGNLFILWFTISDPSLHNPMYFFLGNLSFFDVSFSCVVVPKMLLDFLSQKKTISFGGYISQMHFFHFLGSSEITLLTIMSYDRYLAIGNPLRYTIIMNSKVCRLLVVGCFIVGFLHSLLHTLLTAKLPFCGPNLVKHFFCDIKPVVTLACADISLNINLLNMITGFLATICLLLTMFPYVLIGRLLYNIKLTKGRKRAMSTCSAHFTVVLLYYGTAVFTYLRPSTQGSLNQDRLAAVLFTVVTPALNPIVYTLRNKDMKRAMKKAGKRCSLFTRA